MRYRLKRSSSAENRGYVEESVATSSAVMAMVEFIVLPPRTYKALSTLESPFPTRLSPAKPQDVPTGLDMREKPSAMATAVYYHTNVYE